MHVVDAAVVVTFEPAPDVVLAAVWDGGQWCQIHVVAEGQYGPVLEVWDMHHQWHEAPQISCTPNALRQLVEYRMEDVDAMDELVAWARSYSGVPCGVQYRLHKRPQFSRN